MPNKDGYRDWVLEQLAGAGRITARRMFGGTGLYRDDVFFAIIASDVLYFKVGDANRADYEARGMQQFRPFDDKPYLSMSYYEVPADVLEDPDECVHWVHRSVSVALAARKPTPRAKLKVTGNAEATRSVKRRKPNAVKSKATENAKRPTGQAATRSKATKSAAHPQAQVTAKSKAAKSAAHPKDKIAGRSNTATRAKPKVTAKVKPRRNRPKQPARP